MYGKERFGSGRLVMDHLAAGMGDRCGVRLWAGVGQVASNVYRSGAARPCLDSHKEMRWFLGYCRTLG